MQCVILAAGEGTRMRPLTLERPKPLIEVCGKPILRYIVEALPPEVDELIIVTSYKAEMIREYCGNSFLGRSVSYVVQENPRGGTADALWEAKGFLKGKFLVMYGDDIHGIDAVREVIGYEGGMLTAHSDSPQKFGVLDIKEDGTLCAIIEKPENPPSNFVNIGGFVLTTDIFNFYPEVSSSGEFYLTDSITAYAQKHPVMVVKQETWIPIGYPEDIAKAESVLCPKD